MKYEIWLREDRLAAIEGWYEDGLIDEEVARKMGIHINTLYTWFRRFPKLKEASLRGKEVTDALVEKKLLSKALGKDQVINIVYDEDGNVIQKTIKQNAPDFRSIRYWLQNRKGRTWKNLNHLTQEITSTNNSTVDFSGISTEDLIKLIDSADSDTESEEE